MLNVLYTVNFLSINTPSKWFLECLRKKGMWELFETFPRLQNVQCWSFIVLPHHEHLFRNIDLWPNLMAMCNSGKNILLMQMSSCGTHSTSLEEQTGSNSRALVLLTQGCASLDKSVAEVIMGGKRKGRGSLSRSSWTLGREVVDVEGSTCTRI